jgi:hypothetical protein
MERQQRTEASEAAEGITRRALIAGGATAYGAGALLTASAFAHAPSAAELLASLQDEIRSSRVVPRLRARLLTIVSDAASELDHGQNAQARATLERRLVPLLQGSSGTGGVTPTQARRWITAVQRILSAIPQHNAKLGANAVSNVSVFNCFNEPLNGLSVAGGLAGNIPGYSTTGAQTRYTPGGLPVPRSRGQSPGQFGIGNNAVSLPWDSLTGSATIVIPDPSSGVSLFDDLVLFAFTNQATLVSTRGATLATFPVTVR